MGETMSGAKRITAALVLVAATTAGCAVEASPPKGNCSPSYEERSGLGSFSAQQPDHGAPIDWGLYPDYPAIRFELQVHVGSRLVDERKQTTPPRGAVRAEDVAGKAGQDLTVAGRLLDGKHNTLEFQLKCVIA
jgi:hypothetical protein